MTVGAVSGVFCGIQIDVHALLLPDGALSGSTIRSMLGWVLLLVVGAIVLGAVGGSLGTWLDHRGPD